MKALSPGHKYELANFEKDAPELNQTLQFICKEPVEIGSPILRTVADGTTNEEVLRMLIDRMQTMQTKLPCRESALIITKLEESLMWMEKRTADRKARGVEGKMLK